MTKVVNYLSAKMEMGLPMAWMYLLSNPDHYTNYKFIPFYWQSYVHEARNAYGPDERPQKIAIFKHNSQVVGLLPIQDYMFHPAELHSMCLYDWISTCQHEK
ncbi:hypothetical protein L208DRAFT_1261208 [Tricholoma matsutake]|nr:hypothetical protein L208DRAFT_1261208 [Tricholoma matsutake 945]